MEGEQSYNARREKERKANKAALILHDIGTKDDRKDLVKAFKKGEIDLFLFTTCS